MYVSVQYSGSQFLKVVVCSYYKILAIIPILYNVGLLLILYIIVCTY